MTTESMPEPAPHPGDELSIGRIHSFLALRHISFGDLAGTQYDRETAAPHFVDLVMEEATGRGHIDEHYAHALGKDTKAMLGRFYAIRERNMAAYRNFEQHQLPIAVRMSNNHPTIGISIELAHVLEETAMAAVADDITVAMSQILGKDGGWKPS